MSAQKTLTASQKIAISHLLDGDNVEGDERKLFAVLIARSELDSDPGELLGYAQGVLANDLTILIDGKNRVN
jgi:hypothetical protein